MRSSRRCWKGKFERTIAGGACAFRGEKQEQARSARRSFLGCSHCAVGKSELLFVPTMSMMRDNRQCGEAYDGYTENCLLCPMGHKSKTNREKGN